MSLGGISRAFTGIGNDFTNAGAIITTGNIGKPYNANSEFVRNAINDIKRSLWSSNEGYSLSVVDFSTGAPALASFGGLVGSGGGGWQEMPFPINPSEINQDEPFSVTIRATQTGIITEHEGFITKDLTISGTTGLYPNKGYGGVLANGNAVFSSSRPGYETFQLLRNYVRAYAQFKTDPDNKNYNMVFNNYKDNEFWVVEPLAFSMRRNASSKVTYPYSINFKIIASVSALAQGSATGIFAVFEAIDQIASTVDDILVAGQEIIVGAVDFVKQIEQTVEQTFLAPLNQAIITMDVLKNGVSTVAAQPRIFYENLLETTRRFKDSTSDLLGIGDVTYNAIKGRTLTITPNGDELNDQHIDVYDGLTQIEQGLTLLLASNVPFSNPELTPALTTSVTTGNRITKASDIQTQEEVLNTRASSLRNIEKSFNNEIKIRQPGSVAETLIEDNDSLERIALRKLGDQSRWIDLVVLNDLEYPYIDPLSTSPFVKKPGDTLLIPSNVGSLNPTRMTNSRETPINSGLSATEKFLGIDIQLNSTNDFILNNRSDFELVAGVDNALQAIKIKLGLEKGSLLLHPEIGVNLNIGSKLTKASRFLQEEIERNILLDPRFSAISRLGVTIVDSAVKLDMAVVTRKTNQKVEMKFTL